LNKKFDYQDIEFIFKKSEIINQTETLTDVINTFNTGNLDQQTFLENVYFVKNPDEVLKRLEADRKRKQEESAIDLDKYMQANQGDEDGQTKDIENESKV